MFFISPSKVHQQSMVLLIMLRTHTFVQQIDPYVGAMSSLATHGLIDQAWTCSLAQMSMNAHNDSLMFAHYLQMLCSPIRHKKIVCPELDNSNCQNWKKNCTVVCTKVGRKSPKFEILIFFPGPLDFDVLHVFNSNSLKPVSSLFFSHSFVCKSCFMKCKFKPCVFICCCSILAE